MNPSISTPEAEKPSPQELICFKCSVYTQVILKNNREYPEKLKINCVSAKKIPHRQAQGLFSPINLREGVKKKVYLKLPFLKTSSLFSKPPAKICDEMISLSL